MPASLGKRSRSGEATGPKRGPLCPHGKGNGGYYCKECPGKGICEHGRQRSSARSAGARASASTGGSEASARSAGAPRSASTGGCEARARSAGEGASAITGGEAAKPVQGVRGLSASASTGGVRSKECGGCAREAAGAPQICEHGRQRSSARSAGALRSASTGGCEASARSAGALRSASTGGCEAVQGVRGLSDLRAREAAKPVHGVSRGSRGVRSGDPPPPSTRPRREDPSRDQDRAQRHGGPGRRPRRGG